MKDKYPGLSKEEIKEGECIMAENAEILRYGCNLRRKLLEYQVWMDWSMGIIP